MSTALGDHTMTLARVVGAICRDATDCLILQDLVEKVGEDRRIADVAPGDLDSLDLQRFLIDPKVDLVPDPPFGTTVLVCAPFAFTLDLDPGAVDQQVQGMAGASIRVLNRDPRPTATLGRIVRHRPVKANQPQQALDEPGRLPERHAEQH